MGLFLAYWMISALIPDSPHSLDQISARGYLNVITRNAPTTYFESRDGFAGVEYDMVKSFAKFLGVKVNFIVLNSESDVIAALYSGKGDVAAAGLTHTPTRDNAFIFGPPYQQIRQQVVCRRGGKKPRNIKELNQFSVRVAANSGHEEQLNQLKRKHAGLQWQTTYDEDTESLLEQVAKASLDCTVVDSNVLAINRRYFPELIVAFDLGEPENLTWLFPSEAEELNEVVQLWFEDYKESGKLDRMIAYYYGNAEFFDYVDAKVFSERIGTDLTKHKPMFQIAEQQYRIPWTLLAAQAYQESHWKINAKSPTGVRGIMMLTMITAKELGIKDRMDPRESIMGGAKYLAQMYERMDPAIKEPDRTWFALAAYNVGIGHVDDARSLTSEQNGNPNHWSDVAKVLPLLSNAKYYTRLKHGYARGREPVLYVNNIREYRDILERHFQPQTVKN